MRSPFMHSRVLALPVLLMGIGAAQAQVDCSDPDNLCTGDPCVIGSLTVVTPCVVDFGPRTVVIAGPLRVPSNGTLDLEGDRIEVPGTIRAPANLPLTTFSLAAGDALIVTGRIAAVKRRVVNLSAGGNLDLGGSVRAEAVNATAGGMLTVTGRISARVNLQGSAGVTVADGFIGGLRVSQVAISSTGGDVLVADEARIQPNTEADGIQVAAAGDVTIEGGIANAGLSVCDAFGSPFDAGRSRLSAGGDLVVAAPIRLRGGCLDLFGGSTVQVLDNVTVGLSYAQGELRVRAPSIVVASTATLDASGRGFFPGGALRLRATGGDLGLAGRLLATGQGSGGTIEGTATGNLTASGIFRATVSPPGCIGLSAGGTLDTTGATFDPPPVTDCPGSPSGAFLDREPG